MGRSAGRPAPRSETDRPADRDDAALASSAAIVAARLGSADSPVPVVQKTRAARIASRSSSPAVSVMSGAVGSR
jgi:hypothetical protein